MYFAEKKTKPEKETNEKITELVPWFGFDDEAEEKVEEGIQEITQDDEDKDRVEQSNSQNMSISDISDEDEDSDTNKRPKRDIRRPARFTDDFVYFSQNISDEQEPLTWKEPTTGPHKIQWLRAMQAEIESFAKNSTRTLVDLPEGKNAISLKWIFKLKRDEKGEINRFKARLVARGSMQKYGTDFEETFSPVVRYTSLRFLLGIALRDDVSMFHFDIETAFSNGDLAEEIYVAVCPLYRCESTKQGLQIAQSLIWSKAIFKKLE